MSDASPLAGTQATGPPQPFFHSRWVRAPAHVRDLGPDAGHEGGTVQFEGLPADLAKNGNTLTGRYLSQRRGAR